MRTENWSLAKRRGKINVPFLHPASNLPIFCSVGRLDTYSGLYIRNVVRPAQYRLGWTPLETA
ncbi:MAG: hypothetical protein ABSA96_21005, partial [Candidatus Acidiferrales bacterium]